MYKPLSASSLSQADQLMFAMHFVKGMYPELFQESVSTFVDLEIGAWDLPNVNTTLCYRNGMSSLDPL